MHVTLLVPHPYKQQRHCVIIKRWAAFSQVVQKYIHSFFQTKKTFDRSVIVVSPCLNHMTNDLSLPGRRQLLAISCFGGNI